MNCFILLLNLKPWQVYTTELLKWKPKYDEEKKIEMNSNKLLIFNEVQSSEHKYESLKLWIYWSLVWPHLQT